MSFLRPANVSERDEIFDYILKLIDQAYAKDRQDLLGGIGLHQIGTDAAIIEEFRNRSQRAEMRLKLVFWQAEKDNELDRLVIQPTKKSLTFSPEFIKK